MERKCSIGGATGYCRNVKLNGCPNGAYRVAKDLVPICLSPLNDCVC
jgi:hypothetical protein